jgi:hypothetical protein
VNEETGNRETPAVQAFSYTRVLDRVTVKDVLGQADLKTTERCFNAVRTSTLAEAATRAFTPQAAAQCPNDDIAEQRAAIELKPDAYDLVVREAERRVKPDALVDELVRTDLADRANGDLDAALDALAEFRTGSRRSTRSTRARAVTLDARARGRHRATPARRACELSKLWRTGDVQPEDG